MSTSQKTTESEALINPYEKGTKEYKLFVSRERRKRWVAKLAKEDPDFVESQKAHNREYSRQWYAKKRETAQMIKAELAHLKAQLASLIGGGVSKWETQKMTAEKTKFTFYTCDKLLKGLVRLSFRIKIFAKVRATTTRKMNKYKYEELMDTIKVIRKSYPENPLIPLKLGDKKPLMPFKGWTIADMDNYN